jgi:monoamine oxidase
VSRGVWLERGEAGTADADLGSGRIRDESEFSSSNGGILGSYLSGAAAQRVTALSEARRVRALVDDAERVHPGVSAHYVAGTSKCWDEDRFQRGAYAWFRPGQLTEFGPTLGSAEGRIHFAGDHTSYRPGFMHGALASAKRVVAEILAAER